MARNSGRPRVYEWTGSQIDLTLDQTALAQVVKTFGSAGTIVRIRGSLLIAYASATDGDVTQLGFGLNVVPEGYTAAIDPLVDLEKSWLYWNERTIGFDAASPSGPMSAARVEIDSKAMRKFKPNDTLTFHANSRDDSGTGTVLVIGAIRALVMT